MGPRIIQHDNLDKAPASGAHDSAPWMRSRVLFDWRGLGVLCGSGVIVFLLAYWLFGRDIRYWIADRPWIIYLAVALAILSYAKRWLLIEQPGGYRIFFWQVDGREITRAMTRTMEKYAARTFPNATQLTLTNSQLAPVEEIEGEVVEDAITLVPDSEWLPWLVEMPHTMIAGGTGTGKTTLARIEMFERLQQGYAGIILDPKGKDWFGLPVIGGGREFDAILAALDMLHGEMAERFKAYNQGERHFEPIKALIDEVPDIMDACLDMRRRLVDGRWMRFSRQLGSLAREIGISVTMMTQSPLVEDIGMNSAMRKNFTRIAMGDEAPLLIREERDGKRRAQLQDLLRGQQYPAAMMRRGQVHLLNTSNVPMLAARQIARPIGWSIPQLPQPAQQPARPVVAASAQASATVRASVPASGPVLRQDRMEVYMIELVKRGRTRKQIRDWAVAHGLRFDNGLLTKVRSDLGLSGE